MRRPSSTRWCWNGSPPASGSPWTDHPGADPRPLPDRSGAPRAARRGDRSRTAARGHRVPRPHLPRPGDRRGTGRRGTEIVPAAAGRLATRFGRIHVVVRPGGDGADAIDGTRWRRGIGELVTPTGCPPPGHRPGPRCGPPARAPRVNPVTSSPAAPASPSSRSTSARPPRTSRRARPRRRRRRAPLVPGDPRRAAAPPDGPEGGGRSGRPPLDPAGTPRPPAPRAGHDVDDPAGRQRAALALALRRLRNSGDLAGP